MRLIKSFLPAVFMLLTVHFLQAQTPCSDGYAGEYPCENIDLLASLSPEELMAENLSGSYLNDIWGWTDSETGKEYALVGLVNGTAFVDISEPTNPIMLGMLPEHNASNQNTPTASARTSNKMENSVWRDIKVYKNHVYIVSEDYNHGMQVFDLTQLRNIENPPVTFTETNHYNGAGSAHNLAINEDSGFGYIIGPKNGTQVDCNARGVHIVDLNDPANPVYAGCYGNYNGAHDAQSVIYNGPDAEHQGKELLFVSSEEQLEIVDVTDKANPQLISSGTYYAVGYVHQGWLTEDQQYFISGDELDEYYQDRKTRSVIWDMRDLDNPEVLGYHESTTNSIDHNIYIREALAYQVNYNSGLRILNIADIANSDKDKGGLKEVAYFDTYPEGDAANFNGAWSSYPYFESGTIIVSDIQKGLFILKPQLELFSIQPDNSYNCEGRESKFTAYPNRFDLNYNWQVKEGESYTDLENNDTYQGVNSLQLKVASITADMDGQQFRLKLTEMDGSAEYFSEAAQLKLTGAPEAKFTFEVDAKGSVNFIPLSANATTYKWSFGDGALFTGKEALHAYSSNNFNKEELSYMVTLEASNDCGTSKSYMEVYPWRSQENQPALNVLGLEPENSVTNFRLFPNPTQSKLTIEAKNATDNIRSVSLYTVSGQQLLYRSLEQTSSKYSLNLKAFAQGMYLLKVETLEGSFVQRVGIK